MATIAENLASLVSLQTEILNKLENKGATIPEGACLGDVPQIIIDMPATGNSKSISNCNQLITKFAVFSDIHVASTVDEDWQDNRGYQKGKIFFQNMANENLDFIAFNGDAIIDEGGDATKYSGLSTIYDEFRSYVPNKPIYMISGNHDTGCTVDNWELIAKTSTYSGVTFGPTTNTYYKEIHGDLYIWFGIWGSPNFNYTTEMYDWLFNLLDTNADRERIFLFTHWFDGSVDEFGWRAYESTGSHYNNGWATTDASHATRGRFGNIKNYKNLIWFSGHAHTEWELEETYPTIKVHENNTARMIGIPSLYTNGQCAIVKVYNNMVIIEPYIKNSVKMQDKTYYIQGGNNNYIPEPSEEWRDLSEHPDYVKMTYDVSDTSTSTQLLYTGYSISYISDMIVDGTQVTPSLTYQFGSTGTHTVWMKFSDNKFHTSFAYKVNELEAVAVPSNITNSAASSFKSCAKLKYAYFNMPTSLVDNFIDNTPLLEKVILGENVTGISGTNVLNSNVGSLSNIYVYADTFSFAANSNIVCNVHVKTTFDDTTIATDIPNATIIKDL